MHEHDKKWCMAQFDMLPPELKQQAMQAYQRVYQDAYNAEPCEIRKEGKARREANTRLRQFVKKVKERME